MYHQVVLPPLFLLRAPAKVGRWLAAALAAIAFALVILTSPQHPDDCHPEGQGPTQRGFSAVQDVTPTALNLFNRCPGGPQFSVGDFKFR